MRLSSLTIAIPAYNEEAALAAVLEQSARVAGAVADRWEILVIDDGSRDRTPEIIQGFAAKCPQLRTVRHERNMGICQTIREVLTMPRLDWAFFIPGDGQVPAEEIHKLLPYADRYDLVYGWRKDRADPFRRRVGTWIYNLLVSLSLRRRIHDVDSVALYRADLLRGLDLNAKTSYIHAEFLAKALGRGLRHIEVPIGHRPRIGGQPLGSTPRVIITTACEFFYQCWKGIGSVRKQ